MYCCLHCILCIALAAKSGIVAARADHGVVAELRDQLHFMPHAVQ